MTPIPGAIALKPGSCTLPFFGIHPVLLDSQTGKEVTGNGVQGVLALKGVWPGMARTVYGDHPRYLVQYLTQYKGYYFTGDGATRDKDGYYWITGRVDGEIIKFLLIHSTFFRCDECFWTSYWKC
jgi:acetyl-CoA synthetase